MYGNLEDILGKYKKNLKQIWKKCVTTLRQL